MDPRLKILSAFQPEGTTEFGVVASYEELFLRDQYGAITDVPWWAPWVDGTKAARVAQDFAARSGLEWYSVWACPSRHERARQRVDLRSNGAWLINTITGEETHLPEPTVSGTDSPIATSRHTDLEALPATRNAMDALIPIVPPFERKQFLTEGRQDAAFAVRRSTDLLTYSHISSPLWSLYSLLGFEGMMVLLAENPALAAYACQRLLSNLREDIRLIAALGAKAVWIEECLTDQIHPALFRQLNLPILRQIVEAIRAWGMKSIYYFCGDPWTRMDAILQVGADGLHFEESKKGFKIDIDDVVEAVQGHCVVFGNLDAIGILQDGSEAELRAEIARQIQAGRRNGSRFVMSTGSPITPGTPVERVRLYANLVKEMGS